MNIMCMCLMIIFSFIGTSFCEVNGKTVFDIGKSSGLVESSYNEVMSKGITFKWRIEGDNIRVVLDSPLPGWVAVGFGPSFMMKKANIIIGYVDKGEVFISDDFGTGFTSHKPDTELGGTFDVIEKSGKETDGKTEISFMIPLNSKDKYDKQLVAGKVYKVILAAGDKKDFKTRHKIATLVKIKL